jgi:LmbE family N-acetylglucosaminyl deacetylase
MNAGAEILARLVAGGAVAERVLIVIAHPDDETIGLGAQLGRFDDALLVHLTDGAPRDGYDARNYGFAEIADYAAARRGELDAALRAGGAGRLRRLGLGIPDKEAWRDLAGLARRLAELLQAEKPASVFTHAYEGGHPDHDSAAFAVHAARRLADYPPVIIEMPFYHRRDGRLVTGIFLPLSLPLLEMSSRRRPGSTSPPTERLTSGSRPSSGRRLLPAITIPLRPDDHNRKTCMIECFATQRWMLEQFDLATERFRIAPEYDFRRPPHPGDLHYETLGWGIAGADWRRHAADALDRLGLNSSCPCQERGDEAVSLGREIASRSRSSGGAQRRPVGSHDG